MENANALTTLILCVLLELSKKCDSSKVVVVNFATITLCKIKED